MTSKNYKFGGNGKVLIDSEKSIAVKTLKDPKNSESKKRFLKELSILKELKEKGISNIIDLIDINEDKLEVTMPLYDGDLTTIYHNTTGDVKKSIKLLIPLIYALKQLTELENPIYHRDLKPANILIKKERNDYSLFVADFGCGYLKQEGSFRDTPDFRAVGAQHFRAPEYDYGRVEEINEKGDVFSLGKILWCMINGKYGEVFPYTLWFPKEYNLEQRFPPSSLLSKANLIIAACVDIDYENRPNYNSLLKMMENLVNEENNAIANDEIQIKAKKFEALRKIKEIEIKLLVKNMLDIFYQDMYECFLEVEQLYNDFELISHLKNNFESTYKGREYQIKYKVDNDTESYIFSTSFRNIYLSLNYHRSYSISIPDADKPLPHISCSYTITSSRKSHQVQLYYSNRLFYITLKDGRKLYEKSDLKVFLNSLIEDYISAE